MRSGFSDAEIASYRRDGFLAVNDFLDADELAQWCEAITSTVEANARPLTGKNSEMAFTQRMHLRRVDDRVRRLVDDRCIGRLVATLEGVDALRLYLDQALVKEPTAPSSPPIPRPPHLRAQRRCQQAGPPSTTGTPSTARAPT